ncbi:MAG: amidohydrolase family protein [bacterium]|nr:amidohydrolase family protein [bacterium]
MAQWIRWGSALLALGLVLSSCAESRRRTPIVAALAIEDVTVIEVEIDDTAEGDVLIFERPDHRVVVAGDRIVWVGPSGKGPPAERTVDGRDRFLIPGLWDAHVHFLYDEALTDAMSGLFLDWGITSVRDTGGHFETLVAMREGLRASDAASPRIFLSGPLLDGRLVVYDGASPSQPALGTSIPDAEAAARQVALLAEGGADLIKIYELVSPDAFDALVTAAREHGLPIASHVPLSLTADVAGPRVDSMEHLRNVELACARDWRALHAERVRALDAWTSPRGHPLRKSLHDAQRFAAIADHDADRCDEVLVALRGTMQVPTLRLNAFNRARPDRNPVWARAAQALPEDVRVRWDAKVRELAEEGERDQRFADWSLSLVGRMDAAGVPIGAGTDTPIRLAIPGESLHRELELLVEAGLEPAEALAASVRAPARFMGIEDRVGRIASGQLADLVLLEANPLDDIRNTRGIVGVVSRGRYRVPGR